MLAAAVNTAGQVDGDILGRVFARIFPDLKVVKLKPIDEKINGPLELCQPLAYEELMKNIERTWDKSKVFLELTGFRARLQRAIRQMFFFDQETKFNNVLLHGCDGINDFPWALQIFVVQAPVKNVKRDLAPIRKADILIINNAQSGEAGELRETIRKIRPNLPFFEENINEGFSDGLKENLQGLFSAYEEKRNMVKAALKEKYPDQVIGCEQARSMAGRLRVSLYFLGSVCDECGYRITRCGLGCF